MKFRARFFLILGLIVLTAAALSGCRGIAASAEEAFADLLAQARAETDPQSAKALYEQALALDPSSETALRELLALVSAADPNGAEAETLYATLERMDRFTAEDYEALSALYQAQGRYADAMAALERASVLTGDARFAERLFVYDARALPGTEQFRALADHLRAGDGASAAALALSGDFSAAYATRIPGDKRVCLDTLRVFCSDSLVRAWLLEEGTLSYLCASKEGIVFGTAGYDGGFDGAFSVRYCTAASGDLCQEEGSFASGLCEGELRSSVLWGEPAEDVAPLFSSDLTDAVSYTGHFAAGVPVPPDLPRGAKLPEGETPYAFDEGGKVFLSLPGTELFSFSEFGFALYPEW